MSAKQHPGQYPTQRSSPFLAVLILAAGLGSARAQEAGKVDFVGDVMPLFRSHCTACHGAKQQKNSFRLDRRHDAMKGGTFKMIVPGNADLSQLYLRLVGKGFGRPMPPDGPLGDEQIKVIKNWIDQGASWPDKVAGDVPRPAPNAKASRMMDLLRNGDQAGFRKMLREEPQIAKLQGRGGATPLMYAVLYADAEAVRLLLDAGSDPNVRNDDGATALMWALDDLDKTRLLLRAGANPNARSDDGQAPLFIAANWMGTRDVVNLLLDRGADPAQTGQTLFGAMTPLGMAAFRGDDVLLRNFLDRGVVAGPMDGGRPLVAAINADNQHGVKVLFQSATRKAMKPAALFLVPPFGSAHGLRDPKFVKQLVESGVDVNLRDKDGRTILMLAVSSDKSPPEAIKTLIELGVDIHATTPQGKTALDFARQLGKTAVVDLLVKSGARPGRDVRPPELHPRRAASARIAVKRSLELLQRSDVTFFRKAGCVSCHNNSLTALTVSAARKIGIGVDEKAASHQKKAIGDFLETWRERYLQGRPIPGGSDTANYILAGLAAEGFPADPSTDAVARYLKNIQLLDGHWATPSNRPPLESSDFTVTALAIRSLQVYAPKSRRGEYEKSLWRAADWLRTAKANSTEDRAFQLLGLTWARDGKSSLKQFARELLANQQPNGGWGQLPSMPGDAYATGQVLVALGESGTVAVTDPAYRRGIEFLLSTQLEDGSWYVQSRAIPFQPYFESDFPHGHDQWISVAGTNWATMALITAVDSKPEPGRK